MASIYDRTGLIIGDDNIKKIQSLNVIVIGLGGVGGAVCEALVRAGIGKITIVDFDYIDITNINRQVIALNSTIGELKTKVMQERLLDINKNLDVSVINEKITETIIKDWDFSDFDYVVDAIDDVPGKIAIIEKACDEKINVISSMGTGNKLDPSKFQVVTIDKTHTCPLAKKIRYEARKRNIKNFKVLFSTEQPKRTVDHKTCSSPGSISFVPPVAGMLIAAEVINDTINRNSK